MNGCPIIGGAGMTTSGSEKARDEEIVEAVDTLHVPMIELVPQYFFTTELTAGAVHGGTGPLHFLDDIET